MNFESIIEYQKRDMLLRKIQKEENNDKNHLKMMELAKSINDEKALLGKGSVETNQYLEEISRLNEEVAKISVRIEEIKGIFSSAGSGEDEEAAKNEKIKLFAEINSLKTKLINADRKLSDRMNKLSSLANSGINSINTINRKGKEYEATKVEYEKVLSQNNPRKLTIKEEMEKLKVEPELLALYEKNKKIVKLPVFVTPTGNKEGYSCICGMKLSPADLTELKEKRMCQCKNEACNRLIVLPKAND